MNKNITRTLIIFLIIVMTPFPAFAVNEDYIPIHIDGEYDDWDDKPFTEVYPGNNPPASKINYVSLFRDEDNVYVHVTFATKNNQDITNMIINLYTNMGNENYFLVPDYFWPIDMQTEPDLNLDQSTDLTLPEQVPAEEGSGTESVDQNAPEDQGGTPETTEQDTTTTDQGGTTEPTETTNTTESSDTSEQNILAGHKTESYILVADNDKTDPAVDPAAVSDPETAGSDPATVTTDVKANNGQGNGSGNTDSTVTDPNTGGADNNNGQGNGTETNNGQGNGPEADNGQGNGTESPSADMSTDSGIGTNPTEEADLGDLLDILDPGNLVDLDNVLDQFTTGGAIDSNLSKDLEDLNSNLDLKKPGWYGTWGFSVWDGLFPVGSGYYTRSEGESDELELYIPLSSIAHHYDGITEISMLIKKLGPQHIMCSGVSTGAYIGVAAGAGIALLSVGAYTFKRKRPIAVGKGK